MARKAKFLFPSVFSRTEAFQHLISFKLKVKKPVPPKLKVKNNIPLKVRIV